MSIEFAAEFRGEFLGGEMLTCGAPIGLSMVCGEPRVVGHDNLLNPVMIFEVLSPSTEKHDRGLKFQHYRTIDSLRDYILVHQDLVRIEQYMLTPDRTWTLRDYQTPEEHLEIDSIGVSIPLERIYDRIKVVPPTS